MGPEADTACDIAAEFAPGAVLCPALHQGFEPASDLAFNQVHHGAVEEYGFLPVDGAWLAYARHRPAVQAAAGRTLLLGPTGAERERAHRTIVELSRALAARGHEVFRYDHRGIGESTGIAEECTIGQWSADARRVLEAVQSTSTATMRTTLVGVRIGALIASELFADGLGDAAVFLGEGDGPTLLRDAARRALVAGLVHDTPARVGDGATPVPPAGYAAVAGGREARIDGYLWRPRFVEEAAAHRFRTPDAASLRPWVRLNLAETAAGVPRPAGASAGASRSMAVRARRFWESSPRLALETDELAHAIADWIEGEHPAGAPDAATRGAP